MEIIIAPGIESVGRTVACAHTGRYRGTRKYKRPEYHPWLVTISRYSLAPVTKPWPNSSPVSLFLGKFQAPPRFLPP
jgi:hypothetical protein